MNETHVKERLLPYLDDNLTEGEVRQIEAHLALCTDCGEELAYLRRIQDAVKCRFKDPSPGLWDGVAERIRAEKVILFWGHFEWAGVRLVPFLAAAAVLLLAVMGSLNGDDPTVTLEDYLKAQWEGPEELVLNDTELSRDDILLLTGSVAEPSSQPR
jgi:anti-sigma factor RsiW